MKKILLIDVDSKIPNLALMKLSTHYKKDNNVDFIRLNMDYYPKRKRKVQVIDALKFNRVYVSTIFKINKGFVKIENCDEVFFGGVGESLKITLPYNIDNEKLDYSLYPDNNTSYGFITRGCIRNC